MNPVTIPQLDSGVWHKPRLTPEMCLLVAILELAFHDLRDAEHPERQAAAKAFIGSEAFEMFCDWLNWDAERVRKALLHAKER